MLVLLSIALVLVATVLLVLGLVNDDSLTLFYVSMGCSVAAALVLIAAVRRNKPQVEVSVAEQLLALSDPPPVPAAASVGATPASTGLGADGASEWLASDWEDGGEVDFPIADYDDLTAGQILPLLPQLYPDEIGVVEARERSTKSRPEILDRLAQLGDRHPAMPDLEPVPPAPAPAPVPVIAATPALPDPWADDAEWFPIDDYESLSAAQIRPLLAELDGEELAMVRTRELELGRRRSLLDEIDRRVTGVAPTGEPTGATAAPTIPSPAKAGASAQKAPTKAAGTGASSTRTPAKKATPANKAPATKTSTKKAAASKAPTKKAAASKAPAKKATPAKKAAAPAKKTAKKTP